MARHGLWILAGTLLLSGCWTNGDKGQALSPELAPLAAGVAVFKEMQEMELNLEFVVPTSCTRVTPLDSYRLVLLRLDQGQKIPVVDQFVGSRTRKLRDPDLVQGGRYEAQIFHQDHPELKSKKSFMLNERTPWILLDVPCLDGLEKK